MDPGCSAPDGRSDGRSLLPPKDQDLLFELPSVLLKKPVVLRFRLSIKKLKEVEELKKCIGILTQE